MTQEYRGTLRQTTPVRTQDRLWEIKSEIGVTEYVDQLGNSKRNSTKLSLWVPRPQNISHQVGVFLSLHNPRGRVFTRLQREDLLILSELLSRAYVDTSDAVDAACEYLEAIQSAAKAVYDRQHLVRESDSSDSPPDGSTQSTDTTYLLSDDHPNYTRKVEEIFEEEEN